MEKERIKQLNLYETKTLYGKIDERKEGKKDDISTISGIQEIQSVIYEAQTTFIMATISDGKDKKSIIYKLRGSSIMDIAAHQKNIHMKKIAVGTLRAIATVGESNSKAEIKLWDCNDLLSEDPKNFTQPTRCFNLESGSDKSLKGYAISQDARCIAAAIGDKGTILLIRTTGANLLECEDKQISTKTLLPEGNQAFPVTNICFAFGSPPQTYYLIVSSKTLIYMYQIPKKDPFMVISKEGAFPNLLDCNMYGEIVSYNPDTKMLSYKKLDGKLSRDQIDISKTKADVNITRLQCIGKYLVVVNNDTGDMLNIFCLEDMYSLYQFNYEKVVDISHDNDQIVICSLKKSSDYNVTLLTELPNVKKLNKILVKKYFQIACSFCSKNGYEESKVAEICEQWGDFMFDKNQDEAIEIYIKTIGYTNPSHVIQKYLNALNYKSLIKYLENINTYAHMHSHQLTQNDQHKNYTALLLHCVSKQKDCKIMSLINDHSININLLDISTAIDVLKEANHIEEAKKLAEQANSITELISLLIEGCTTPEATSKNCGKILDLIQRHSEGDEMNQNRTKLTYLKKYGPTLLKALKEEAKVEIERVAVKFIEYKNSYDKKENSNSGNKDKKFNPYLTDIRDLINIFSNEPALQMKFIETIFDKDENCDPSIAYMYIEQCLQNIKGKGDDIMEKSLQKVITKYSGKLDKRHVLMLFQMYNYIAGVENICKELHLYQELLNYYMHDEQDHYERIMELFSKKSDIKDDNLFLQALNFFASQCEQLGKNKQGNENKLKILQDNICELLGYLDTSTTISIVVVMQMLAKAKNIKYKVVKRYLTAHAAKMQKTIKKSEDIIQKRIEEIEKNKQQLNQLRTSAHTFQLGPCSQCSKQLDVPFVHFLCGHTYHEDTCFPDSEQEFKECPKCQNQNGNIKSKKFIVIDEGRQEEFMKQLNESDSKIDVIAEYFKTNVFSNMPQNSAENSKI